MSIQNGKDGVTEHFAPASAEPRSSSPSDAKLVHGNPEITDIKDDTNDPDGAVTTIDELEASKKGRFAYFKTRDFYIVLVLG